MPLHTSQGVQSSGPLTCRPLMTSVTAGGYTQSPLCRLWWLSSILCPHLVILLPNCHWMCLVLLSWWLVTDWTLYPLLIYRYLLLCAPVLMYACLWFYAIMICCYATIGVIWPHITSSQLSNTKPDTEYKMSYVNLYNRIYFAVTSRELWPMLDSNREYFMTNVWCKL